jgi:hypothetical protein
MNQLHPAAIALGTLLSLCAYAQQPADARDAEQDAHPKSTTGDHSQEKTERSGSGDDEAPRTLDGDPVLEGQRGDSTDQANPGGPQGDGRNDPGMLE